MLTKDSLYGMHILTLVGLLLTAFGLTLRRKARAALPLCISVMSVGATLVLAGLGEGRAGVKHRDGSHAAAAAPALATPVLWLNPVVVLRIGRG